MGTTQKQTKVALRFGTCVGIHRHIKTPKAMATFAVVLLGLIGLTSKALVEKGRNCVDMLTGNASFTLPAGFLASITAACNALEQANEEVLFFGGKVNYQAKRVAEVALADLIRELAGYIQGQSGGDATKILSAGFDFRKKGQPVEKIDMVLNLRFDPTNVSGLVDLRWNPAANATNYQTFLNRVGPDQQDAWELVGFTSKARQTISSLEPGKSYWFRVVAIGRKGLVSTPSQVVKVIAA